ncbi:MAG: Zn-dependent hydrolase [Rhodospirillales bacterium]|nr:Zn-dependent hydrolase [Rhodospirillales bacterium]
MKTTEVARAIEKHLPLADRLFKELEAKTKDGVGITRHGYGPNENVAYELFQQTGRSLGLEVTNDAAGNLYLTLPGKKRDGTAVMIGSHMDSVPHGGNFDGAAGIVGGIVAAATIRETGLTPDHDITVMGIRCEESPWFGIAFVGSKLALGLLPIGEIDTLKRSDTGRTLAQHMADIGLDPNALRKQKAPHLAAKRLKGYLELHIEQGPLLINRGIPIGIATGIRGYVRWPEARCIGRYDHASAVPRSYRSDAVLAVTELLHGLDRLWSEKDAANADEGAVFTVGKMFTDPTLSAMSKVPGEVSFTLNCGSTATSTLDDFRRYVYGTAKTISEQRRVSFDLKREVNNNPTVMDPGLRQKVAGAAKAFGIPSIDMATVGHDASIFTQAGVPSTVILMRNDKGSHNPDEEMEMSDFALGTQVLAWTLADMK